MAEQGIVNVTIINRNYPPGQGITGESAAELAGFLIKQGVTVHIVHVNAKYEGGNVQTGAPGIAHKINTFYSGKRKIWRLLANLYEGFRLVKKAKSLNPDVIICMTDPPLLNFWAALLLPRKQRWILWAMDLYPEAFVSAKLVSKDNFFYRLINNILIKNPPGRIITLGECQKESLQRKYEDKIKYTNLPCGIFSNSNENGKAALPWWANDQSKVYLGYCGNIGEAHSKQFLFSIINHFDPSRFTLILALYGAHAMEILAYAKDKPGVVSVNNVNRSELGYIDIHLASLVPEWVNVSVPSKTVSSVCAGAAFLYNGIPDSDNWQLLCSAGWLINDPDNIDRAVKLFLDNLTIEEINKKKEAARILALKLNELKERAFFELYNEISMLTFIKAKAHNTNYAPSTVIP